MAISDKAKLQMEDGQTLQAYVAMATTDRTVYTSGTVWSGVSDKEPIVRPNGIATGRDMVVPAVSLTNNMVDVAAFTAYSKGVLWSVTAAVDQTITRGATANIAKISSITMTDAGAIAIVAGTDSADSTINETRGANGGPPLIPVDSVEIAQVRFTGTGAGTAAPITAAQIFQVVGSHTERTDYPSIKEINNIGLGSNVKQSNKVNSFIEFASAVPASHTGPVGRKVWIQYYIPVMADQGKALDFKPVENSHSVSSKQYYGGTVAGNSSSIGQGGVTFILGDGITDGLVSRKNTVQTFKFFQDRNKPAYILTQGKVGIARTFPVGDQVQAAVTISAETISAEFNS